MSEADFPQASGLSEPPSIGSAKQPVAPSDWLGEATFGQGLQRSIYLLRTQFRWFIFVFFIGSVIITVIAFPVTSIIGYLNSLIFIELFSLNPDFILLAELLIQSLLFGLLESFIILFGVVVLNVIAVRHAIKTETSLRVLNKHYDLHSFPLFKTIGAGLVVATLLTLASIIPLLGLFIQALLFFVPVLLVLEGTSIYRVLSSSVGLRHRHWQRILGAVILGYVLILFAGTLGHTIYLNIDAITTLYGIQLGIIGPILLILLTQLPIAMVAPILPLLSLSFFAGAEGARRETQHLQYMKRVHKQQPSKTALIPFDDQPYESITNCSKCGTPLRLGHQFCTSCGTKMDETNSSS